MSYEDFITSKIRKKMHKKSKMPLYMILCQQKAGVCNIKTFEALPGNKLVEMWNTNFSCKRVARAHSSNLHFPSDRVHLNHFSEFHAAHNQVRCDQAVKRTWNSTRPRLPVVYKQRTHELRYRTGTGCQAFCWKEGAML